MNTKCKILAIGASGILMATSFTACSQKDNLNYYTALIAGNQITNYTYDMNVNGNFKSATEGMNEDVSFGLGVKGTTLESGNISAALTLKAAYNGNSFESLPLTDLYVVDNVVYINLKALLDAVPKMAVIAGEDAIDQETIDSLPQLTASMGITTDYITVDLTKLDTESLTGGEVSADSIDVDKLQNSSQMALSKLTASIDNAFKDVQIIGKDKDKYTLTINNDNLNIICDTLITYIQNDLVNVLNDIASTAESNGDADFAAQVREAIPDEEAIAEAVANIQSVKDESAGKTLSLNSWTTFTGSADKHNRVFALSFTGSASDPETSSDMSFSILSNVNEIAADTVITPPAAENCWSADELLAGNMSMIGGDAALNGDDPALYTDSYYSDFSGDSDEINMDDYADPYSTDTSVEVSDGDGYSYAVDDSYEEYQFTKPE